MTTESICFISEHGISAPIDLCLLNEGVDCHLYVHEKDYRPIYKNIIPRLSLDALERTLKSCSHVVIDMVRPNHGKPEDIELLKRFGVNPKAESIFGPLGDRLRKLYPDKEVIGGSALTDRWELNREEGIAQARRIGLKIPEYHKFNSFQDGAKFVYRGPGKGKRWVIKPNGNVALDMTYASKFKDGSDILDLLSHTYPARFGTDKVDFILQAFVDGAELSSALWIYKGKVVSANRTFESKQLIEGDKGPNVGSASNTVWQCKNADGIVHKQMQGLLEYLGNLSGEVDANCIIDKNGDAHFLEWTLLRYGLDALYCQQAQIPKGKRAAFWLKSFKAKYTPGFAASQRLTIWPAPRVKKEEDRKEIRGNLINHSPKDLDGWWLQDVMLDTKGKLRVAGVDGLVGVKTCVGDIMEDAINAVQKECLKFEVVGNKQFRTDHLEKHSERMKKLKSWGINLF